jgi:hypothetical protein
MDGCYTSTQNVYSINKKKKKKKTLDAQKWNGKIQREQQQIYQTTWHHIPKDRSHNACHHDSLKSQITKHRLKTYHWEYIDHIMKFTLLVFLSCKNPYLQIIMIQFCDHLSLGESIAKPCNLSWYTVVLK